MLILKIFFKRFFIFLFIFVLLEQFGFIKITKKTKKMFGDYKVATQKKILEKLKESVQDKKEKVIFQTNRIKEEGLKELGERTKLK